MEEDYGYNEQVFFLDSDLQTRRIFRKMRNPSKNTIKMLKRRYPYLFEDCDTLIAARYAVECLQRYREQESLRKYLNAQKYFWKLLRIN